MDTKSVDQLFDSFVLDRRTRSRRGLSEGSAASYRSDLANAARRIADRDRRPTPLEGSDDDYQGRQLERISVDDFTPDNIAFVISELVREGKAPNTRARMLASLRGLSSYLVRQQLIPTDPTDGFETPAPDDKLPVALTEEELDRLFSAVRSPTLTKARVLWPTRDILAVAILAGCGARASELARLQVGDFSYDHPATVRLTGKGRKTRTVPLPAEILEALDVWLLESEAEQNTHLSPTAPVFIKRTKTSFDQLDVSSFEYLAKLWYDQAGVKHAAQERLHALRHTYAISQIRSGTRINDLQQLMGHASINTTAVYLRVASSELAHTAKNTSVNRLLNKHR